MRLTAQDKIEFLKAAVKADDLEELKRWLVAVVDASESDTKEVQPVPPFRAAPIPPRPAVPAYPNGSSAWGNGTLPVGNGASG